MAQPTPRRVATIVWSALLTGPTLFLGLALFLVLGLRGGAGLGTRLDPLVLIGGSLGLSVVTVALSWIWAVRMRIEQTAQGTELQRRRVAAGSPTGPDAVALTRLIVSCALCEGGALCACVVFLVTGQPLALLPYALSWIALAAHFPGDRHWKELSGGAAADAPRSPMSRG